ncbi:MAG: four helix bundle protein [Patescibacteria group bacterium]
MENPNDKKYDLQERTSKFGEEIIEFAKKIPKNEINRPLVSQVVRAGTSIGANYMEADCSDTKKDFKYKISLCKKEAKETTHWLRMIAKANESQKENCRKLWKEARELTLIFSSIINTSNKKVKSE